MQQVTGVDLKVLIKSLTGKFQQIEAVHIFGSRRYKSGSTRSDIDLLLTVTGHIKPADLRGFATELCPSLDLFVLENGKAVSAANESFVTAGDNASLITDLNALLLFDRADGYTEGVEEFISVEIDNRYTDMEPTALPNASSDVYEIRALAKYFLAAEKNGLPVKPYLGVSVDEATSFVTDVIRRMLEAAGTVTRHGQAHVGWTASLKNEYDFQNLFWLVAKPWLPSLGREEVAIKYDGQEKRSDFSMFNSKLIIEFKHINDDGDKRAILKTLSGLREFYLQHANVKVLLFAILVEPTVEIDAAKWESDYSYEQHEPSVRTIVVRNGAAT